MRSREGVAAKRPAASLKMQAIGWLSRREHSRQELRLKLLAAARRREREAQQAETPLEASAEAPAEASSQAAPDPQAEIDHLLDWLSTHGYLSDARFVESRVHARASRQGSARIQHELARHGLALDPAQAQTLRESEFARAQAIWRRKFAAPAADARERAKQARFLAGRGFAAEIVRRVVGGLEDD